MPGAASPGKEIRAGSRVLSLFENPLNTLVLRAHATGPKRLGELQEAVGRPAQSTVRAAIGSLCAAGALSKQTVGDSSSLATVLTAAGREMLVVADEVEAWLKRCPAGPIALDSEEARIAVKALGDGWSSTLMHGLANRPFTLTELDGRIPGVSYPSLERRVSRMRTSGQIEPVKGEGRGTPYVAIDWLRHSIAPLAAASRCERRHLEEESGPITAIEVEAAFLLAVPLAPLRKSAHGNCMLVVRTDLEEVDEAARLAGVAVEVERGEVTACVPEVLAEPTTWAVGSSETWLEAVIDGRIEDLRIGGVSPQLALDLVTGMHLALYGDR